MALTPKKVSEETAYLSGDVDLANAVEDGFYVAKWDGSAYESRFVKGAVAKQILNTPLFLIYEATISEIRSGSTSPFEVIPSPGVNYFIKPLSFDQRITYNSVQYNGVSGYADLITDTAAVKHFRSDSQIIKATSNKFEQGHHTAGDIPELIAGKGLKVKISADSTLGDSIVWFYISYQIMPLV